MSVKHFFTPPYGSLFVWIAQKTALMRWCITASLLLIMSLGWYYAVYNPIQHLIQCCYQLPAFGKNISIEQLATSVESLEKEVHAVGVHSDSEQKDDDAYQKYLLQTVSCIQERNARLIACTTGKAITTRGITKIPVTYTIQGSLDSCAMILRDSAEKHIPLSCKRIVCTLATKDHYTILLECDYIMPEIIKTMVQ
jgi:hypothetical protein